LNKTDPFPHVELGYVYYYEGSTDRRATNVATLSEGLKEFDDAIASGDKGYYPLEGIAYILAAEGRYRQALVEYRPVLTKWAYYAYAHVFWADLAQRARAPADLVIREELEAAKLEWGTRLQGVASSLLIDELSLYYDDRSCFAAARYRSYIYGRKGARIDGFSASQRAVLQDLLNSPDLRCLHYAPTITQLVFGQYSTYNGQHVDVRGTVGGLKQNVPHNGSQYVTFSLCDRAQCIHVVGLGNAKIRSGQTITVHGIFRTVGDNVDADAGSL
jgi:hypothetical protein